MNNTNPLYTLHESKAYRAIKYGKNLKKAEGIIKSFASKHHRIDNAVTNYKPGNKIMNRSWETSPFIKAKDVVKKDREDIMKTKVAKDAKKELNKLVDKNAVKAHKQKQQIRKSSKLGNIFK